MLVRAYSTKYPIKLHSFSLFDIFYINPATIPPINAVKSIN
jgi:hypothetical protein